MKWFRVPKESSPLPKQGKYYFDWKDELCEEAQNQCVYCTIHSSSFGGIRNFHVEHYKPKSKAEFAHLKHDYSNLFYACSICNCFKGSDWPNDPTDNFDNHSFPDPSKVDYSELLASSEDSLIESPFVTGRYIIQKLFLNRPQLILERKKNLLKNELNNELTNMSKILAELKGREPANPIYDAFLKVIDTTFLMLQEDYISPYKSEQISR